jgi:membrane dipeptidase
MLAYARQNQLAIVRTGADVDAAMGGKHSVLLASESAEFISTDLAPLKKAFDLGLRQLQLVHYIRNPIGDFSTASPVHNGLSPLGRDLVKACESHGILLDLAHCSTPAIDHAMEIATKPMVWSHGWVDSDAGGYRDQYGYLMRRLSIDQAKKIAARGGVVGLWGLGLRQPSQAYGWKVGMQDRAGYAREVAKLVNMIGADHVAFGTDIAGVGSEWAINDYGHVREIVQLLEGQKLDAATIEKVAFGNFARVLKATLPA